MRTTAEVRRGDPASVASALRLSVMRLARRLRLEHADTNLSTSQLAVLATLERHGPLTPGELAAHERVQPPSMTKTIGCLEEQGLVARSQHPTDRRQALVAATPEGVRVINEDRRRRDEWLAQRVAKLTAEEVATLRDAAAVLDRLARE